MTVELTYLALLVTLTVLMRIPYLLFIYTINVRGIMGVDIVDHPESAQLWAPPWVVRLKTAYKYSVENLIVFATLVLVMHAADISNAVTALACIIYFWSRVAHLISDMMRIPWVNTVAFFVGFGCLIALGLSLAGFGTTIIWLPLEQHAIAF